MLLIIKLKTPFSDSIETHLRTQCQWLDPFYVNVKCVLMRWQIDRKCVATHLRKNIFNTFRVTREIIHVVSCRAYSVGICFTTLDTRHGMHWTERKRNKSSNCQCLCITSINLFQNSTVLWERRTWIGNNNTSTTSIVLEHILFYLRYSLAFQSQRNVIYWMKLKSRQSIVSSTFSNTFFSTSSICVSPVVAISSVRLS